MPFNGSGGFEHIAGPDYPAVADTLIRAAMFNANIDDICIGLGNTITRDGQSPPTANLPMGNFKFTGLAAANSANQALTYNQADAALNNLLGIRVNADPGIPTFTGLFGGKDAGGRPQISLYHAGAPANEKAWMLLVEAGGDMILQLINDAYDNAGEFVRFGRTGNTPAGAAFNTGVTATSFTGPVTGTLTGDVIGNVTGNLTGNSAGTHTGAVVGSQTGGTLRGDAGNPVPGTTGVYVGKDAGGNPQVILSNQGAAANEKNYDFIATTTQMKLRYINDAFDNVGDIIVWDRITNGAELITINSKVKIASAGLDLPNASTGGNTLDWFERNTGFSPGYAYAGDSTGVVIGSSVGRWTRIGNTVFLTLSILLTTDGSAAGAPNVTGLPFAAASGAGAEFSCELYGVTGLTGVPTASISAGQTFITLQQTSATGSVGMTNANFNNGAQIRITGFYFV